VGGGGGGNGFLVLSGFPPFLFIYLLSFSRGLDVKPSGNRREIRSTAFKQKTTKYNNIYNSTQEQHQQE
jgi:hypothetical protein